MVDFTFLTRIATIYTQTAHGRACVVKAAPPNAYYLGQAYLRSDGFFGIDLRLERHPPAEMAFTFWHEIAHLVTRPPHVAREDGSGTGLHNVDAIKSDWWREEMRAYLLEGERLADEWANKHQVEFTARHGPIERLLVKE